MKYLILAAGIGKRLIPLTNKTPKCLLKIDQKPIVEHILKTIDPLNRVDKFIVTGREGSCWNRENYRQLKAYPLRIIYNSKNIRLENAYSLLLGLKKIGMGPVIIVDGDILFKKKIFVKLLNSKYENVLLSRPMQSPKEKGGRIRVGSGSKVIEIGESVSGKSSSYIYSGMAKIGKELAFYFIKNLHRHKKIVDALNEACKLFDIYNLSFRGSQNWINVNSIEALKKAREIYGKKE